VHLGHVRGLRLLDVGDLYGDGHAAERIADLVAEFAAAR